MRIDELVDKLNDLDDCDYCDLLVYQRKLDDEEVWEWEFEYIGAFKDEF